MSVMITNSSSCLAREYCCLFMGIQYSCLYQNGKEKDNSLCSFVPRDATAIPDWELWALPAE